MTHRLILIAFIAAALTACASTPTPTTPSGADVPTDTSAAPEATTTPAEDPTSKVLENAKAAKTEDDMFGGAVKTGDDFAAGGDSFKAPTEAKTDVIAKPEVAIGATMVKGDLDREKAAKGVKNKEDAIKKCFQPRIVSNGAKGSIIVTFKLKRTGGVTEVKKTKSTLNDDALDACVIKAIETVVIPGGKGDVSVIQPIFFNAP